MKSLCHHLDCVSQPEPGADFCTRHRETDEQRLRRIIREELTAWDAEKERKRLRIRRAMGPG